MANSVNQNPTSSTVAALLPKLTDADSDLRYMSLNDLYSTLNAGSPNFLHSDYNISARTIEGLLKTLDDQNGEVQNQAIKWYEVQSDPDNELADLGCTLASALLQPKLLLTSYLL